MNLCLLNPYDNSYPEVIEKPLDTPFAVTVSFNRRGTLIAIGCNEGRVQIMDLATKGVARVMERHVRPVTSLSWSKNGKLLLSCSNDGQLVLWDVLRGCIDKETAFDSPLIKCQMHPHDNRYCIVCPVGQLPQYIDLSTMQKTQLLIGNDPDAVADDVGTASINNNNISYCSSASAIHAVCTFSRRGDKIFVGDQFGLISVVNTLTFSVDSPVIKVPGSYPIKSISLSRNGKYLLINSSDKSLRLYDTETLTLRNSFQDIVNRLQWKCCCFSGDGDYIIGGSAQTAAHNITIWSCVYGEFVKMLEGPKEGVTDLVWHPNLPIIASCSSQGIVYIWAKNYTQHWSAFAPDFKELDQNEIYEERENEFDIVSDGEEEEKGKKDDNESGPIDIITIDKIAAYSSESEDELLYLPTAPEPDPPMTEEEVLNSSEFLESERLMDHSRRNKKASISTISKKRKTEEIASKIDSVFNKKNVGAANKNSSTSAKKNRVVKSKAVSAVGITVVPEPIPIVEPIAVLEPAPIVVSMSVAEMGPIPSPVQDVPMPDACEPVKSIDVIE